jgi:periplasmic copper chaperone A
MGMPQMIKNVMAIALLGMATLALSACGQQAEAPVEAAPEGLPGITISNARLVLPAVKGNPGAMYFDVAYDNAQADRPAMMVGVSVEGAESAMFHSSREMAGRMYMEELMQVPVAHGETVSFKSGGYHVMAMNLADTLAAGDTTEATITFLGGDKASFPVKVNAPGDDG